MIRLTLAPEPANFDRDVRQRGLDAIRELVGEERLETRTGPKREKVAATREAIPPNKFPAFWTDALEDMLRAYNRICAYSCLYIHPVTGSASIDHMLSKSTRWDLVYEWTNYRLACGLLNSRKGTERILDPCEIDDGWFQLEFDAYQVIHNPQIGGELAQQIADTIDALKLNNRECLMAREEYVCSYLHGDYAFSLLEKRAVFIARELRRQGLLRAGDR